MCRQVQLEPHTCSSCMMPGMLLTWQSVPSLQLFAIPTPLLPRYQQLLALPPQAKDLIVAIRSPISMAASFYGCLHAFAKVTCHFMRLTIRCISCQAMSSAAALECLVCRQVPPAVHGLGRFLERQVRHASTGPLECNHDQHLLYAGTTLIECRTDHARQCRAQFLLTAAAGAAI